MNTRQDTQSPGTYWAGAGLFGTVGWMLLTSDDAMFAFAGFFALAAAVSLGVTGWRTGLTARRQARLIVHGLSR